MTRVPLVMTLLTGCATEQMDRLERVDAATTFDGLYAIALSPEPDPPTAGPALLALELTGAADGVPVQGALIELSPWMPDHGHGISGTPEVLEVAVGVYEARWSYAMPGYWEISVYIDADAGSDEIVVAYEVQ